MNTTGTDNAPVSVSKVLTDRVKDYDKWAIEAAKWSTGAPTVLLVPVNMMRNKNDPTGFDVRVVSRKKEARLFERAISSASRTGTSSISVAKAPQRRWAEAVRSAIPTSVAERVFAIPLR